MQKKITFNGTGICNFQLITYGSDISTKPPQNSPYRNSNEMFIQDNR